MQRTPKKWDLVTDATTGEPESYVYAVRKPRSTVVVTVCQRGAKAGFTTCRSYNQPDFVQQYQWNEDRHLAGTWEPRSNPEQEGGETLGNGDDHATER